MHQPASLNWAIGDYVLDSVIRAGGRATVYAARRRGVDELRALKVITIGAGGDARTVVDAERRGAELQQAFARRHGLVPWVEEIGETPNCLYVAMEYVPGEDLFDILARGPLPARQALEIAIELATFLERTHGFDLPARGAERIIHADLKPGNVRVRPDGHIRVLDFGIAKAMAERRLVTTQKWGTRQYMSPEWLQTGTIDEQVDYWSLGVLLYEMLAGYRPFRRFERHDNQLEDAIRRGERPEALPRSVDMSLQRVLWRLLAPETRQRYAHAGEIRVALEACRWSVPALPVPVPAVPVPAIPVVASETPASAPLAARADVPTERVPDPNVVATDSPATEPVPMPGATPGALDLRTEPVPMPGSMAESNAGSMPAADVRTEPVGLSLSSDRPAPELMLGRPDSPPTEPVSMDPAPIDPTPIDPGPAGSLGLSTPPLPPPLPRPAGLRPSAPRPSAMRPWARPPAAPPPFDGQPFDGPSPGALTPDGSFTPVPSTPSTTSWRQRPFTRREVIRNRVLLGCALFFALIFMTEGMACVAAEHLRTDAAVADEPQLDAALKQRTRLAGWTLFDIGLHVRADPVLKRRLSSFADGVITNYRQEQPTVTRADWERARRWLSQAVGLYPSDERLLSKLRYTEGQLQRLLGLQRGETNQAKNARQSYYAAIQKFQEAAALDPKSPDPYLGLTQTYIYGLGDVDAALEAQEAAEKRGYRLNRRERAAMGDGYRARGERTWRSARSLKGEQQKEAYERAQDDFKRCVESFGPITEFANAADQLHRCEARLAEIDSRKTPWWEKIFGTQPQFDLHLSEPAATPSTQARSGQARSGQDTPR